MRLLGGHGHALGHLPQPATGCAAVSAFVPNVLVDILRGVTTDAYGDEVDTGQVAAYGVPVAITETTRLEREPGSTTPRTVRTYRARFRPGAGVRDGDRLRVTGGGSTYRVEGVGEPTDVVGAADILCGLVRVT